MTLEKLRIAGVQQAHNNDKIDFSSSADGRGNTSAPRGGLLKAAALMMKDDYDEDDGDDAGVPRCAAIFVGPEFGAV